MSAAPYVEQPRAILDGRTYPGALLYFYESGTLSPLVTIYADPELTTPLPNPLSADAGGRWPAVYLDADAFESYRARCTSSDGDTLVFDDDGIDPQGSPYSRQGPALDASGSPLGSATLEFFAQRTTTHYPIYSDAGLTEQLNNPVSADASGVFPDIFMDGDVSYRVIQRTAPGELVYDIGFLRGGPISGPGAPQLFGTEETNGNDLTWTASQPGSYPVVSYELEKSDNGTDWTLLATVSASDPLEYFDEDSEGAHYYRVRAQDTNEQYGSYSNVVEITHEVTPTDPYWSSVIILLTADTGTLTEWSGIPTWSKVGIGDISTEESKFGGYSFYNPGTANQRETYVRFEEGEHDGLFNFPGAFTIEFWAYVTFGTLADGYSGFLACDNAAGALQYSIQRSSNTLFLVPGNNGPGFNNTVLNPGPSGWLQYYGEWVHHAITRDSDGLMTIWLNGSVFVLGARPGIFNGQGNSGTTSVLNFLAGCNAYDNSDMVAYVDQLRVTKGVCRYTAAFTPPTAPFPKAGP